MRREVGRMSSRGSYFAMMVVIPLLMVIFFVTLLGPGLPLKVPTAIVDLDHSPMSRKITRNLDATELISISQTCESYDAAMKKVREGSIFGFFVIPANFEKDVLAGNKPSLEYFNNLTYFVPGTLAFKGFKTVAVTTSGGVVRTMLMFAGLTDDSVGPMLQPVSIDDHPIANPWLNYNIYLSPSFLLGTFALLIMIMSTFSITMEIKYGTSAEWLRVAGGRMSVALLGKLTPHFVVWSVMCQFMLSVLFCYLKFPCGNLAAMMLVIELFIIASQAMGVLFSSLVPNPRLAFTLSCLIGVLTFSFAAFSFPVQSMYGYIAILSYLVPVRYMFLTYIYAGLNSLPVYYSRYYILALMAFPLVASLLMKRLKKACLNPIYVP